MGLQGWNGGVEAAVGDDGIERGDLGSRGVYLCGGHVCDDQADCRRVCEREGERAVQLWVMDTDGKRDGSCT